MLPNRLIFNVLYIICEFPKKNDKTTLGKLKKRTIFVGLNDFAKENIVIAFKRRIMSG